MLFTFHVYCGPSCKIDLIRSDSLDLSEHKKRNLNLINLTKPDLKIDLQMRYLRRNAFVNNITSQLIYAKLKCIVLVKGSVREKRL